MAPFSSNLLNALRYRWMFACGSRLRRLQTCATGMERPLTSHHGPNLSSHAQYQKAQLDVRLRFEIAQVANLRYRNGRGPLRLIMAPTFSHMLSTKKRSWIFACGSRLRRLQTCATGKEGPPTSHHGPNVFSHAQYQEAQLDVRLQFKFSQVTNLRYRSAYPKPGLPKRTWVSFHR